MQIIIFTPFGAQFMDCDGFPTKMTFSDSLEVHRTNQLQIHKTNTTDSLISLAFPENPNSTSKLQNRKKKSYTTLLL